MKTTLPLLTLFLLAACAGGPSPARPLNAGAIDADALRLMKGADVQGLALAVISDGRVEHVAAYGRRSVERNLPLRTDTVMYGASLTKTAVAFLVLQLVDEGRLRLDAPVAELLPRPLPDYPDCADLAGDERWRALTPRICCPTPQGSRISAGSSRTVGCASTTRLAPDMATLAKDSTSCRSSWRRVCGWTWGRRCSSESSTGSG